MLLLTFFVPKSAVFWDGRPTTVSPWHMLRLNWRDARYLIVVWLAGMLVFSLSAYMYRLTRPKATLVTCPNCGKPRRPDADICHHCGSKWDVPELTPPA